MLRRTLLAFVSVTAVVALLVANALATPASTTIVVVTARGALADELNVNRKFDNDTKVKIKTKGAIELITQRIEAPPGATFGWHSHPGENVNVVFQGTLTFYHDEDCTEGIAYGPGTTFSTHPEDVHLARNEGTENLVLFATYFAPKTTPPTPVRLDAPLPSPGCPQ